MTTEDLKKALAKKAREVLSADSQNSFLSDDDAEPGGEPLCGGQPG